MPTRTLRSASELHAAQVALAADGVKQARRSRFRGIRRVIAIIREFQAASVDTAVKYNTDIIREQRADPYKTNEVVRDSLLTDPVSLANMLQQIEKDASSILTRLDHDPAFDRLVASLIADAERTAMQVDSAARPAVDGYVRVVGANCCSRCALLAGRVYRFSQGFYRHDNCQCTMVPVKSATASQLAENPADMFRAGRVTDLTRAETRALNEGADFGRVINVKSKKAGLREGSSVMIRAGKPTPAYIYRIASDVDEVRKLMRRYGYLK